MDSNLISKITNQVYREFPEVKGSSPKITQQAANYLLVFKGSAKTADGHTISRVIRVVVNTRGDILKTTTSR